MDKQLEKYLTHLFRLRTRGIKPGLTRIQNLVDAMDNPEKTYPIIHVAGTNGKGSTSRILDSFLMAAGYKTGLYTSPHLTRFNERIKINNHEISNTELSRLFKKFEPIIKKSKASFFEITTAMALDYFRQKKVDIVILEVGLGGRFDATNIVTPAISVITPISKDHEEFLGSNIESITKEKAGIIKPQTPVVIARQETPKITKILQNIAAQKKSTVFLATESCKIHINKLSLENNRIDLRITNQFFKNLEFPLPGAHMVDNLSTALTVLRGFPGLNISKKLLNSGLKQLSNPGRFEIINRNPLIIYDVAHNYSGIKTTLDTALRYLPDKKFDILITLKATKNINNFGTLLKKVKGKIYISELNNINTLKIEKLYDNLIEHIEKEQIITNRNLKQLLPNLLKNRTDPLLILGSHYIAGDIYDLKNYYNST